MVEYKVIIIDIEYTNEITELSAVMLNKKCIEKKIQLYFWPTLTDMESYKSIIDRKYGKFHLNERVINGLRSFNDNMMFFDNWINNQNVIVFTCNNCNLEKYICSRWSEVKFKKDCPLYFKKYISIKNIFKICYNDDINKKYCKMASLLRFVKFKLTGYNHNDYEAINDLSKIINCLMSNNNVIE